MIWSYVAVGCIVAAGVWQLQEWRHDSIDLERVEASRETERLRSRTADKASAGHETFKERERVRFQTITETVERLVDRPVYRNVCIDADGLRALNAAITGRDDDPGEPAHAVP